MFGFNRSQCMTTELNKTSNMGTNMTKLQAFPMLVLTRSAADYLRID